jgi:hypothetical protein
MKTILSFVKGALGLAVLVAFALVLVGLFGPLSQKMPVGQQAYPIGTVTPTAFPLPVTPTLEPYPPPQTPTVVPPATPTFTPTPRVTVTPGPITSKLEIIWAESTRITTEVGPNQPGIITFWQANIADLAGRMSRITMPQGYSLKNASLSPDGSKIAFTTLPPPPNSQWWLLGTLWVVNVDSTGLKELAQAIDPGGWLGYNAPIWSPDNRTLIYVRLVPKELPTPEPLTPIPSHPLRYELYSVAIDDGESKFLVADDIGLSPLGWSSDSKLFYYWRSTPGGCELWAVETIGGKTPQFKAFMDVDPRSVRLSPDATKLVFNTSEGLILLSTDGRKRKVISSLFGGIWSPDSTEIIGRSTRQTEALNVNTRAVRVILTDQQMLAQRISAVDEILSVSPDGRWLAMKSRETGGLYLSGVQSNVRVEVPGPDIRHTSYFVGWISPE